ncbi:hypothetical protein EIL87_05480 [Saccharopolyspora rhizosphaerae]|uniref:Ferredoxin n=1 Tax=Saccharopolyspora rhizosphaerae TaxID=2492662 RepID=A0A426K0I6_9PSEU|nr:hypothetical protein [Saccharopolyspora rhizosphaerae]RRO18951.1 hypothetical protein EIL87_05480 [Saccharopolyspora rhizosphaerae]
MSQPEPPGSLDEATQQQLIQEIGRVIVRALPPGWQEATTEYRAVGGHVETSCRLIAPNGSAIPLAAPSEVDPLFARLRHGMHQPDRGTWFSAVYRLQRPGSYAVDFNGDQEPDWQTAPPASAYAEELRLHPRPAEATPQWLTDAAAAQSTAAPTPTAQASSAQASSAPSSGAPSLRTAEVFDDRGKPITERAEIGRAEADRVAEYLEKAPVVLAARSYDDDRLDPQRTASVPMTFHTDGNWIWPGAVGYYLRQHGVAPEPDLLNHIRARGFQLPEVSEPQRELAVSVITGERR